jgi:hypothetical protein
MKTGKDRHHVKRLRPIRGLGRFSACALVLGLATLFAVCITPAGGAAPLKTETAPVSGTGGYSGPFWSRLGPTLDTPEKVSDYINYALRYKEEPPGVCNHTQSPEETVELGTGDCEDFAFVIVDALRNHGYETDFLTVEALASDGTLTIHALGVYRNKETGQWHYIQKGDFLGLARGVSDPGYDTLDAMATDVARRLKGVLYKKFVIDTGEKYIGMYDKDTRLLNR